MEKKYIYYPDLNDSDLQKKYMKKENIMLAEWIL